MAEEKRSLPTLPGPRPDVLSTVEVQTTLYGNYNCLVRRVNRSGIFLQTMDLLPLGTEVRMRFADGEGKGIVAVGLVQAHHYINYADLHGPNAIAGMSVRFKSFEAEKDPVRVGQETLQ